MAPVVCDHFIRMSCARITIYFCSDRKVRDKALDSLTQFLRSRNDLTLIDLLKLWKGLFFCKKGLNHSDKPQKI